MKRPKSMVGLAGFMLAAEVALLLTDALGTVVSAIGEGDFIRVEAHFPAKTTDEQFATVLTALRLADSYGHDHVEPTDTVWALIPIAPQQARG
jgi:hypothetical protein